MAAIVFVVAVAALCTGLAVGLGARSAEKESSPELTGDLAEVWSELPQGQTGPDGRVRAAFTGQEGASSDLAQIMLQSAMEGILVLDAQGKIVSANNAALHNLGYENEDAVYGQNVHKLIHHSFPDGLPFPEEDCPLYQAVLQGREASIALTSLRRSDNSQFLASARVTPIRREQGQAQGALLIFLDITEQHTQETIRQTVFAASTDAYIIFSNQMEIEDANPAALNLFKVTGTSAFRKQYVKSMIPPLQADGAETLPILEQAVTEAWSKGSALLEEILVRDMEGTDFPCRIALVRIDLGGRQVMFFNLHDLRSLRQAEAILGRERQHQQILLDTNPLGVAVISDSRIAWLNPRANDLVGLHVGARLQSVFVHHSDYFAVEEELERYGILRDYSVQMFGPKREIRDIYLTALRSEFQGEPGIVAWMMDITDLKASEKALTEARDAAEAATRAKCDFLAHMSHEIRTPMNAILGMSYLCQQTQMTNRQRDYLSKIQDAAHSLMAIINDILDFSQSDGNLVLESVPFQLDSMMDSVCSSLQPLARKKNLEFLMRIDPLLPNELEGDSLRLTQVLHALGNNAIKFTDNGEVMISLNRVREDEHSVVVRFSVTDTGIGMSDAEINRLFQPFTQADGSSTRRFGGTGLGLAICKRIIALMDGHIWVESTPGEGSTFQFSLRFTKKKGVQPFRATNDFLDLRAMVVDDSPTACAVLAEQVKALGFHVNTAVVGREALATMEKAVQDNQGFALLLLDWRMPDLDGLEMAHLVRMVFAEDVRPITILVTESGMELSHEEMVENGLDAFLHKPISPYVLRDAITPLLSARQASSTEEEVPVPQVSRVLLVEDNEINQEIALCLLESMGIAADIANNGKEAVEKMQSAEPGYYRLIFMDIQMPVMDGLEATQRIRKLGPHTANDKLPIVAMTAHAQAADREKSLSSGMNAHITKPLIPEEMAALLSQWIGTVSLPALPDALPDVPTEKSDAKHKEESRKDESRKEESKADTAGSKSEKTMSPVSDAVKTKDSGLLSSAWHAPEAAPGAVPGASAEGVTEDSAGAVAEAVADKPVPASPASSSSSGSFHAASAKSTSDLGVTAEEGKATPRLAPLLPTGGSPNLSTKLGLDSVGGNQALYAKLLRKFQDSCRTADMDVKTAITAGDFELATRVAHTVKGVSASLGLMEVSQAAAVLEHKLRLLLAAESAVRPDIRSDSRPDAPQQDANITKEDCDEPILIFGQTLQQGLVAVAAYLEELEQKEQSNRKMPDSVRHTLDNNQLADARELLEDLTANLEVDWGAVMDAMEVLTALLSGTAHAEALTDLGLAVENFDIPHAMRAAQAMVLAVSVD